MTRHRPSEDYNTAREEYYFLQSEVSQYDQRCLSIKGWSITVSFALIALAFAEDVPALLIASVCASSAFWMSEAIWKKFQQLHINRIKVVEKWLLDESFPPMKYDNNAQSGQEAIPDQGATPPEQETTPPEQETTPPEQGATPPEQETTPPEQETTPPEQGATPKEEAKCRSARHTTVLLRLWLRVFSKCEECEKGYQKARETELQEFSSPKIHSSFARQLGREQQHYYSWWYCMGKTGGPHLIAILIGLVLWLAWVSVSDRGEKSFVGWNLDASATTTPPTTYIICFGSCPSS